MKARLLPLKGKYYGTTIELTSDSGLIYEVALWNNDIMEPSERELEARGEGISLNDWRENRLVLVENINKEKVGGEIPDKIRQPAREVVGPWDDHFENKETYETARKLVDLINGKVELKRR